MQPLEPRHALAATADPRLAVFLAPPVDKTPPVIVSVTAPADKTYAAGAVLSFTVGFSENVRVTGSPALPIDIGGSVRNAFWDGKGSNSKLLTFTTKVLGGDSDTNGLSTKASLVLSGGSIRDPAGNAANLALPAKFQSFPRVLVDGVGPAVRSFSAITADTWQKKLTVTAVFGEAVTVTGNPTIPFTLAGKARQLVYGGGSGSSRLTFTYAPGNKESLSSAAVLPQAPVITLPARAFLADRVGNRAVSLGGPVAVALSGAIVAGNRPAGTVVGTLSAVDPDGARDPATFTLVSGPGSADNAFFAIDGTKLVTRARLDNESRSSLTARVRARDAGGLWVERAFAVAIASGNDAPTAVALVDRLDALVETASTASRMKVANIAVTDDGLGTNVLTLAGPDAASFEIVGTTLCLKAGVRLDAATKPSYAVSVSVADPSLPGGMPPTADFRLAVMPSSGVFAGFGYAATRDGVTITRYSGAATDVVIPARIHGLPVSAIGLTAFRGRADLASVTLPAGVTSIGALAFFNCRGLKSMTIPAGVTSIGDNAFAGCTSLTSVTIPASVTSIGDYAFFYCMSLTSVTIPAGVTSIGDNAFDSCTSLTSVTIPAGVTSIGGSAFYYCKSLTSVTIPASVTTIGKNPFAVCSALTNIGVDAENPTYASVGGVLYDKATASLVAVPAGLSGSLTIPAGITKIGASAFASCVGLTNVTIPASVTTIGDAAFKGCTGLTSVTIPAGVTTIGDSTFSECMRLTSVSLPAGITSIGNYAFDNCRSLTSVTIPAGVRSIGILAFIRCMSLTSVTIPASVTSLGLNPFVGCDKLTSIEVDVANANYASIDGLLYDKAIAKLLAVPAGLSGPLTVPAGITSIGDHAFSSSDSLTSVTIPEGVTRIGSAAFSDCMSLQSVTIPASVTSLGSHAFGSCTGLKNVTIPAGVTTIGDYALYNCVRLTSVTIPASVTSIGRGAFHACNSLVSVVFQGDPPALGGPLAGEGDIVATVAVYPAGNAAWTDLGASFRGLQLVPSVGTFAGFSYSAAGGGATITGYSGAATDVVIPANIYGLPVSAIGDIAFSNRGDLTSVTLPAGIRSIGSNAFARCVGLTSVTIPAGVTTIGDAAFGGCTGLTSVTIPAGVTSIGRLVFYSCTGLTSVTIPVGVTSIGSYAFAMCTSLTSMTIPAGVTSIGDYAFDYCTSLTSVTIPAGVTSIGDYAFSRCTSLTSLMISAGVTSIGRHAFSGCWSLTSVAIPATVTGIGEFAFLGCSGLTSVTIPAGVTSIGSQAFSGCQGLTSVAIPASVTSIGTNPFAGCVGLRSIGVDTENPRYASLDGLLSDKATASLIAVPSGLSGSLTIPAGITRIGDSAFSECRFITSVTIPVGVTSIGAAAFVLCNALTSVTIPAGVTTIGESAFAICSRLTSVTIPASVTSIGRGAFHACDSLASVVFQGDPPALGGPLAGEGEIVATVAVYPVGNAAWAALGGTFGGLTTRPDDGPAIGGLTAPASSA